MTAARSFCQPAVPGAGVPERANRVAYQHSTIGASGRRGTAGRNRVKSVLLTIGSREKANGVASKHLTITAAARALAGVGGVRGSGRLGKRRRRPGLPGLGRPRSQLQTGGTAGWNRVLCSLLLHPATVGLADSFLLRPPPPVLAFLSARSHAGSESAAAGVRKLQYP